LRTFRSSRARVAPFALSPESFVRRGSARTSCATPISCKPIMSDLTKAEIRDEILSRLGKTAFAPALEADVARPGGGTHASDAETGWPWHAATESALVIFLHSLPDGSRGLTPSEAALALGRPGIDLGYVHRALEETERRAWYMRRDGEHFLFRTRGQLSP
jgi:hypothetical protein